MPRPCGFPQKLLQWLMGRQCGDYVKSRTLVPELHDNSGDHAGSEAKPGVGTFCSFRPEISIVNKEGPELPPGSRKNMMTRPLGQKVGPSLWNPSVRMRSPLPSGFMTP